MSVNVHLPLQGNAAGVRGGVGREEGGGGARGAFVYVTRREALPQWNFVLQFTVDPVQWECERFCENHFSV